MSHPGEEKDLNDRRDESYACSKAHGFHDVPKSMGDYVALIHSEVSEAYEDFRAGEPITRVWYVDKQTGLRHDEQTYENNEPTRKPCGIPSEMADIIIRVLDFCGAHGIDIETAVEEKHAYNLTRPFKHGKII